ncbi:MAG: DUF4402 domain-containing protein [Sphingomicrobium sp.]
MAGLPNFRCLLAALALVAPSLAEAAPVAPNVNATGTATITNPASLRKLNDLNFGNLSVTTAGTATVNPTTEALTTTGGAIVAGGLHYSALFEAVSPVKNVVIIRIPKTATTVTRVGGTETMTVDNWTLSGNSNRNVVAKEPFQFNVGGTLYVNANQVEGLYVGTFTVDIQYP